MLGEYILPSQKNHEFYQLKALVVTGRATFFWTGIDSREALGGGDFADAASRGPGYEKPEQMHRH